MCGVLGKKLNPFEGADDVVTDYEDGEMDNGWIAASSDTYPKVWDSNVPFDAFGLRDALTFPLHCCLHR